MHGRTAAAKNDRHLGKTFPHKAGKGDALYTRQFLIRNDESRMHPLLEQGQRRFRISGGDDGKPHLVQQLFKKIEYARIIVHNEDFPGCAAGRRGAGLARGETVFNRLRDGIDGRYRFGEGLAGCFASIIPFGRGKIMRQEYGKEGPAAGTVGHAHRSPVTLDEAVDLREPKAAAPVFLFCSKEGIKNEFHEPRRDAFPGIGNVYADIAALGKLVSGTVPLHGVEPGGNCELHPALPGWR